MMSAIHELVNVLFQKEKWEQCTEAEIRQLAATYPYMATAQLLLAKKLKENNSPSFASQKITASLYYPDALWLEQLLDEPVKPDMEIVSTHTTEREQPATKEEVIEVKQQHTTPVFYDMPSIATPDVKAVEVAIEKTIVVEDQVAETAKSTGHPVAAVPAESNENNIEEQEEPVMTIPALKIEPIDPATAQFDFQPYHTVDYFASQGIKSEDKPRDKFGQQLKSFTEWLKVLKKTPVVEIAHNVAAEKKVEQLAEHSLSDKEVITEAMAEVWEKQGNREKAIRIYDKLSLLNPSKSSYFAAKIDHLKNS